MKSMNNITHAERKSRKGKRKSRKGERKSRKGERNLEKKTALSTTAEEEACDDLQGKRYPITIIKINEKNYPTHQ